jgi:DNA-binding Lrp family transcriptional regulator
VRLADVLSQADGATKRFVHYLEARGHIQPRLIEKARIARRDYSDEDARRVAAIWTYHRRGVSVENAVALVDRGEPAVAYVLFRVAVRRWAETLDLLQRFAGVRAAAIVYGEEADLVAELSAPDDGEVYAVLAAVTREAAITSPPTILRTVAAVTAEPRAREGESNMQAYVVVKASAKQVENTLERLRALNGIAEAAVVYGETDVICRVEVADQERLDQLVMRELHEIPTVESTRTYIVVGGMSWRR